MEKSLNSIDSMQLARTLLRNLGFEANPTLGEKFVGDQFNYYTFSLTGSHCHSGILWPSVAHYYSLISRIQSLIGSQGPCSALSADATLTHFLPLWLATTSTSSSCHQHHPPFPSPVAASLFFLPLVLQVKQALAGTSTSSRRTSRRETERRRAGIWRGKRWKSRKWKEYFKKGERVTFNFSRLVWQHSWTSWTFLYKSCWVTCQKWHKFDRKYLRRFLSHLRCHHQQLLVLSPQKGIWHSYRTSLYT